MWNISYSDEEHWNTVTHGLGILLSLAGAVALISRGQDLDAIGKVSIWAYSIALIFMFSVSTAYHAVSLPGCKKRLRILDHICIYYLIAGTYMPVALIVLRDTSGWLFFWLTLSMALVGTILKIFFTGRFEVFSMLLYLLMGWLIVIDIGNLLERLTSSEIFWLATGGICYTFGILFYAISRIPFNHMIWHFFVLGGAISHWLLIWKIVSA